MKTPKVNCCICGKPIPTERVKFLLSSGVAIQNMTTVNCSTTKKKKGVYMGEYGTSEMKIVDKLYEDTVRSIFRRAAHEIEDSDDDDEPVIGVDLGIKKKTRDDEEKD